MSLLHAEYLKVSRRKLFPIMIVLLASLMGFIALLFYVLLPAIPDALGDGSPIPSDRSLTSSVPNRLPVRHGGLQSSWRQPFLAQR